MVWMYISSFVVLTGAEINCELHKMRAEAKLRLNEADCTVSEGFR